MDNTVKKICRFFEIDLNYLQVSRPFKEKIINLFSANTMIVLNLLLRKRKYPVVMYNKIPITYDTPFATKTFMTAVYDFYSESKRGEIFNSSKPVVIDVGANIGQFLFAVKTFFPLSHIYSIEPDPRIYDILKKNANYLHNVTIYNEALSSKEKELTFYINREFSEWSSLRKIPGKTYNEITVHTKVGDELFKNIKSIDLLKIDVEGAELDVIKGMNKTLERSRFAMVEVSMERNNIDPGSTELIKEMFRSNFYIYHIGRIFSAGVGREQGAVDVIFKNKKYR